MLQQICVECLYGELLLLFLYLSTIAMHISCFLLISFKYGLE